MTIQPSGFQPTAIIHHLIPEGTQSELSGIRGYPLIVNCPNEAWEGIYTVSGLITRINALTYNVSFGEDRANVRYHKIKGHPPLMKMADKIWDASRLIQESQEKAHSKYSENIIRVPLKLNQREQLALGGLAQGLQHLREKEEAHANRHRVTDSTRAIQQMREIIEEALVSQTKSAVDTINRALSYLTMLSFTTTLNAKEVRDIQSIHDRVKSAA
jgi:hypothetical protein